MSQSSWYTFHTSFSETCLSVFIIWAQEKKKKEMPGFSFFPIDCGSLMLPQCWTQMPPRIMFSYRHKTHIQQHQRQCEQVYTRNRWGLMEATGRIVSQHKAKQWGHRESFFFNLCVVPHDRWKVTLKWIKHWYLSKTGAASLMVMTECLLIFVQNTSLCISSSVLFSQLHVGQCL